MHTYDTLLGVFWTGGVLYISVMRTYNSALNGRTISPKSLSISDNLKIFASIYILNITDLTNVLAILKMINLLLNSHCYINLKIVQHNRMIRNRSLSTKA